MWGVLLSYSCDATAPLPFPDRLSASSIGSKGYTVGESSVGPKPVPVRWGRVRQGQSSRTSCFPLTHTAGPSLDGSWVRVSVKVLGPRTTLICPCLILHTRLLPPLHSHIHPTQLSISVHRVHFKCIDRNVINITRVPVSCLGILRKSFQQNPSEFPSPKIIYHNRRLSCLKITINTKNTINQKQNQLRHVDVLRAWRPNADVNTSVGRRRSGFAPWEGKYRANSTLSGFEEIRTSPSLHRHTCTHTHVCTHRHTCAHCYQTEGVCPSTEARQDMNRSSQPREQRVAVETVPRPELQVS